MTSPSETGARSASCPTATRTVPSGWPFSNPVPALVVHSISGGIVVQAVPEIFPSGSPGSESSDRLKSRRVALAPCRSGGEKVPGADRYGSGERWPPQGPAEVLSALRACSNHATRASLPSIAIEIDTFHDEFRFAARTASIGSPRQCSC